MIKIIYTAGVTTVAPAFPFANSEHDSTPPPDTNQNPPKTPAQADENGTGAAIVAGWVKDV